MRRKLTLAVAAAALAVTAIAGPVGAAGRPDIACQRAGLDALITSGLISSVARDGLPIATAVGLGVTVREGADISGAPDPLPLPLILADHRAGDASLFVYPWC
jgi:hypothetical protein